MASIFKFLSGFLNKNATEPVNFPVEYVDNGNGVYSEKISVVGFGSNNDDAAESDNANTSFMSLLKRLLGKFKNTNSGALAVETPPLTTTGEISTQNLNPSGVATPGSFVEINTENYSGILIQTLGTYTGALSLQITMNNTEWITVGSTTAFQNVNTGAYGQTITSGLQSICTATVYNAKKARITALSAVTNSVAITLKAFSNPSSFALCNPLPAGSSQIGSLSSVTTLGTPVAPTTPYFLNSAATTNGALILTGTSGLQAFYATNTGASPAYVKLYNKATAPTVGTDVPEMIIPIPAAVAGVPGIAILPIGFQGFRFALGLGIAITGGAADTDTTTVAAGQVKVKLSRTI